MLVVNRDEVKCQPPNEYPVMLGVNTYAVSSAELRRRIKTHEDYCYLVGSEGL